MKKGALLFLLLVVPLFNGCVAARRTIELNTPSVSSVAHEANKGELCITTIIDNRAFQNNPKEHWIPSMNGDVTTSTSEQKAAMIGRLYSRFERAVGEIALPEGDSVIQRTRSLTEEVFRNCGYKITSDSSAPYTASISIDEFWAWFTPGFWIFSFEAKVTCTITLQKTGSVDTITIKGYGMNKGHVVNDANWQLAYERAFLDFLANAKRELDGTEF